MELHPSRGCEGVRGTAKPHVLGRGAQYQIRALSGGVPRPRWAMTGRWEDEGRGQATNLSTNH
eukprot:2587546-Pyramimonas_sp.AAC.1